MKIIELDKIPENVISLSEKRIEYGKCKHHKMIIDEELEHITCKSCNEKLNPMTVLLRFAHEEKNIRSSLIRQARRFDNISKKLAEKKRTKCKHCGKMTSININLSELEWRGFK